MQGLFKPCPLRILMSFQKIGRNAIWYQDRNTPGRIRTAVTGSKGQYD